MINSLKKIERDALCIISEQRAYLESKMHVRFQLIIKTFTVWELQEIRVGMKRHFELVLKIKSEHKETDRHPKTCSHPN